MLKSLISHLNENPEAACTQLVYEVTQADLPLSCPGKHMRIWDAHPKIYLPIEATGKYRCPYCSAEYILKNDSNHS